MFTNVRGLGWKWNWYYYNNNNNNNNIKNLSIYFFKCSIWLYSNKKNVKWSRYRPGVAQRVGRGIAILLHDRSTSSGVSGQQHAPAALYPRGKTRYPLYRRLGGPQGRSGRGENLVSTGIRSRAVQPVAQSLYRLSYSDHNTVIKW